MVNSIYKLIERDLDRLADEIKAFPPEKFWTKTGEVRNSAGNLALHICGNLKHFIGAVLGGTDYIRDREFEFNATNVPVDTILSEITKTKEAISFSFNKLNNNSLADPYPLEVFGYQMSIGYFLIHLQGHLNYHLGQINYLRRLL